MGLAGRPSDSTGSSSEEEHLVDPSDVLPRLGDEIPVLKNVCPPGSRPSLQSLDPDWALSLSPVNPHHVQVLAHRLHPPVDVLLRAHYEGNSSVTEVSTVLVDVAHDLLLLADDEPYGVRGANLAIRLTTRQGEDKYLGNIALDESTVSTFTLTLTLYEEKKFGVSLRNWLGQFTGRKQAHLISPRYALSKEKLYRRSSGVSFHFQR